MLKTFHFKKTALVVATSAAVLGVHMNSTAQQTDQGTLTINGQIQATTCILGMGNSQGAYTLNLGSFTTLVASNAGAGNTFGTSQSVIMRLLATDGVSNCALGTSKWDIGINPQASDFVTVGGRTFLVSQGPSSNAAQNVGVLLSTTVGANPTTGTNALNLANSNATYGVLLSNGPSSLGLASTDRIALTAQFARTGGTGALPTAGAFSVTIPLNVWYK